MANKKYPIERFALLATLMAGLLVLADCLGNPAIMLKPSSCTTNNDCAVGWSCIQSFCLREPQEKQRQENHQEGVRSESGPLREASERSDSEGQPEDEARDDAGENRRDRDHQGPELLVEKSSIIPFPAGNCRPIGTYQSCSYQGTTQGYQICDASNNWGSCMPCTGLNVHCMLMLARCTCFPNGVGYTLHNIKGVYEVCKCVNLRCDREGKTQSCACSDENTGTQICDKLGNWSICSNCQHRADLGCTHFELTRSCVCANGKIGLQACAQDGRWTPCHCL